MDNRVHQDRKVREGLLELMAKPGRLDSPAELDLQDLKEPLDSPELLVKTELKDLLV